MRTHLVGPDASGGRYWVVPEPPDGFPYVPRYKTDTYAVEFVRNTCPAAEPVAQARYIANMGALIERGDTKVLFDPLFSQHFNLYDPVPRDVEAALLSGTEPFDNVDAVFISHHHGDHFDPALIVQLLRAQPDIKVFGPEQAATAIRSLVDDVDALERIHGLSLANGETAVDVELDSLLIEAMRIPHAGWPNRHSDVENLVFRVTLDGETTVMHFGDAEVKDEHYAKNPQYWQERHTHFAMPPYWFFLSAEGRNVLEDRIAADHAVGMHVPHSVAVEPADRDERLRDADLFTTPGETRTITVHQ